MCHSEHGWPEICRKFAVIPYHKKPYEEMVSENRHANHSVEDETDEMGKSCVGNAIRSPGTMVIHLRDTSAQISIICISRNQIRTVHTACNDELWAALPHRTWYTIAAAS